MPAKLSVSLVHLSELTSDPSNARTHGDRNIEAIKSSLKEFGQVSPLVVQADTGRVIGGNGTLQAMQALGWEAAEVVTVAVDDARATALGIALNRTAELAAWDMNILGRLLEDLAPQFSPDTVGFSPEELDRIINRDLDLGMPADEDAETTDDNGEPRTPGAVPAGGANTDVQHVRLVQLFFNEEQHETFISLTDRLAERLHKSNLTDTVMAAVQGYYNKAVLQGPVDDDGESAA